MRDSHDRYANIEVADLLQRIEDYEGLRILATNRKQNAVALIDFAKTEIDQRHRISLLHLNPQLVGH